MTSSLRIFTRVLPALVAVPVLLAGCGSSKSSTAPGAAPTTAPPSSLSGTSATVSTGTIGGVGTVLVDGSGHTLYLLTSEKGGKVTCTTMNGCAIYWPALALPSGATAAVPGNGVQQALLGVVKNPDGGQQVTYAGYPLHTFSGDSQAGTARGEGVKSFGGTWWAVSPSGSPVTSSSGTTPTTASSSGGGYGY